MVGATLQPHRPEQSTLKSGRAGGLDIRVGSPILRLDVNRKQARMERPNDFQSSAARSLRALGSGLRHAERLLLRIPILLGVALSLAQTPPVAPRVSKGIVGHAGRIEAYGVSRIEGFPCHLDLIFLGTIYLTAWSAVP